MTQTYFNFGRIIQAGIPCWAHQDWLKSGFMHGFAGKASLESIPDEIAKITGISRCLTLKQIHSDIIVNVNESLESGEELEGDAFIFDLHTKEHFIALIKTADCVPLIIKGTRRCALVHAGWRGLANGIVKKAANCVIEKCANRSLEVVIGPSACKKCYEVGLDVGEMVGVEFLSKGAVSGKYFLDLAAAAKGAVISVRPDAKVIESGICTMENQNYYSYRREKENVGRNYTFVAI